MNNLHAQNKKYVPYIGSAIAKKEYVPYTTGYDNWVFKYANREDDEYFIGIQEGGQVVYPDFFN